MDAGKDPRPDQNKDRPGGGYGDPGTSDPKPAPGGVGTDTPGDPANAPNTSVTDGGDKKK